MAKRFQRARRGSLVIAGTAACLAAYDVALAVDAPGAPTAGQPSPVVDTRAPPRFYIHISALYLTRGNPDWTPIVSSEAAPGTGDIFGAYDLDFGWRPGVQARAGMMFGRNIGVDIGYFWVSPFIATFDSGPFDPADILIETTPATTFGDATQVIAENRTAIDGVDGNILFQVSPSFTLFAGATYIKLHDTLEVEFPYGGVGAFEIATWDILNRMVGPQIGARVMLDSEPGKLFLMADFRTGVLYNWIENSFNLNRSVDPGTNNVTASANANSPVWMLGGGVTAGFQVSETVAFTLGYQALLLDNVGLAPDQVPETDSYNVVTDTTIGMGTATNTFWMHGVNLGLALKF